MKRRHLFNLFCPQSTRGSTYFQQIKEDDIFQNMQTDSFKSRIIISDQNFVDENLRLFSESVTGEKSFFEKSFPTRLICHIFPINQQPVMWRGETYFNCYSKISNLRFPRQLTQLTAEIKADILLPDSGLCFSDRSSENTLRSGFFSIRFFSGSVFSVQSVSFLE